ncbi:MAG: hypothetical protein ACYTE3_13045 [Planctomycetota bacterium]|jgi:hypothetical protein
MISRASKAVLQISACSLACSCLFFAGCEDKNLPSDSNGILRDRLRAAKLITVSSEKDAALERVAEDAAEEADGKIVLEAITEISQTGIRNSAAANVAPLLVQAGKTKDAIEVIGLINDTSLRNKMLTQIATEPGKVSLVRRIAAYAKSWFRRARSSGL